MKWLILAAMVVLMAACKAKIPGDIIAPDRMKPIVFDLMKADVYVDNYVLKDSTLKSKEQHTKFYEQVFAIHNTTRETFYNSMAYYQKHPDLNKALFDSISTLSSRQKDALFRSNYGKPATKAP